MKMASEAALNAANLARLGADRLAQLLLELTQGDAAAKRQLRLELKSRSGGDVGAEIRKRLVAIAKSRSFIDWRKIRELAQDLDSQRTAIMSHIAPSEPAEAFDLLWRLLELAPKVYERCDDSNGAVGAVMSMAMDDLGAVARRAKLDPAKLAERVVQGVESNDYGQFDGLIALMAEPLGQKGLAMLKSRFEDLPARPATRSGNDDRRIIGMGPGSPMFEDDHAALRHEAPLRPMVFYRFALCQRPVAEGPDVELFGRRDYGASTSDPDGSGRHQRVPVS